MEIPLSGRRHAERRRGGSWFWPRSHPLINQEPRMANVFAQVVLLQTESPRKHHQIQRKTPHVECSAKTHSRVKRADRTWWN
jgi:hypothetical protein